MPEYRFKDGEGKEYRLKAQSREAAIAAFGSYRANKRAGTAVRATPKPSGTLGSEIGAIGAGGQRGIAKGLGAPVDLVQGGINLGIDAANALTGSDIPYVQGAVGGSQWITDRFADVPGMDPYQQAQTGAGRLASRAAEEVGAYAVPATGAAGSISRNAQGVTGTVRRALVDSPKAQIATSAGAGVGAGIAEEAAPNSPMAEFAGAMAGGLTVAGGHAAARGAGNVVKSTVGPFTKSGQERIAGERLRAASADPDALPGRIDEGLAAAPNLPGSRPTTAAISGDAGIATLERGMRSGSPATADRFARIDAGNAATRRRALEGIEPNGHASDLAAHALSHRQSLHDDFASILAQGQSQVEQQIASLGQPMQPQTAGQIIRGEFDNALSAQKQRVSQAYDPVDQSPVPIVGMADNVRDAIEKYLGPGTGGPNSDIRGILNDLYAALPLESDEKGAMVNLLTRLTDHEGKSLRTFAESLAENVALNADDDVGTLPLRTLQNMRSRAADVQRTASDKGNSRISAAAGAIVQAIDGGLEDAAGQGLLADDLVEALNKGGRLRKDQARIFEAGAAGRVRSSETGNLPALFFNGRATSEANMAQFVEAMGGRAQARDALQSYAIFDALKNATEPGTATINPTKLRKWIDRHGAALKHFPGLRMRLASVSTMQEHVNEALSTSGIMLRDFDRTAFAQLAGHTDATEAVGRLFSGGNSLARVRQVMSGIGDNERALAGFRRAIVDHALSPRVAKTTSIDAAGEFKDSPAAMIKFLRNNRRALSEVFSAKQLETLDRVLTDIKSGQAVTTAGSPTGSATKQNQSVGYFLGQAANGAAGASRMSIVGRVAGNLAKAARGLVMNGDGGPNEMIDRLIEEAMVDPALALELVRKATPARANSVSQDLADRIMVTGAVSGITTRQESERRAQGR
ncbi:MAG: hypothetical protein AAGD43_03270 [Pseudomonadota bacterium]